LLSRGVFVALNAAIAGTSLVIGLVTRLMTVPGGGVWPARVLPAGVLPALAALRRA